MSAFSDAMALFKDIPKMFFSGTNQSIDENLRNKVETLAKMTPRFLFRAWDHRSDGHEALNTEKAIIPHAFYSFDGLPAPGPSSIYNLSHDDVVRAANMHLDRCSTFRTVFSSWSQSVKTAIWNARARSLESACIAILDTQKLGGNNLVLYSPLMKDCYSGVKDRSTKEFLAFGVIPGEAYGTVRFNDLVQRRIINLDPFCTQSSTAFDIVQSTVDEDELRIVRDISQLFRKEFQFPIACYLLSLHERHPKHHDFLIKQLLGPDFDVYLGMWDNNIGPKAEMFHQAIPNRHIKISDPDAIRAMVLMQDVITEKKEKKLKKGLEVGKNWYSDSYLKMLQG